MNGVLWSDIETAPGVYDWSAPSFVTLTQEIQTAHENGYQIILIVRSASSWAQALPGYSCGPIAPESQPAFANFMRELVQRLSVAPYGVKHWAIWNEPDIDHRFRTDDPNGVLGCWGNWDDPYYGGAPYAQMLKLVYPQIKLADPQAQVIVGGLLLPCAPENITPGNTYCAMTKFLEGVVREMALNMSGTFYFDGVGFNGYDYFHDLNDGQPTAYGNPDWNSDGGDSGVVGVKKLRFINDVLAAYGAVGKTVYNTEAALACQYSVAGAAWCEAKNKPPSPTPAVPNQNLLARYDIAKAFYAPKLLTQMSAEGATAIVWYNLKNNTPDFGSSWFDVWTTGLLNYSYNPPQTPPFAFTGYTYAASQLGSATFVTRVTSFPNAFVYEFNKPGRKLWVAWTEAVSPTVTITFPSVPLAITNGFYAMPPPTLTLTLNQTTPIGYRSQPFYIEWAQP